jgi:uncharacterized membrane protein YuzA (DUF378 family)
MSGKMSALDIVATTLVIVGALNWGFVALGWNLVEAVFGTGFMTTLVYGLVGISALWSGFRLIFK